MSPELFNNTRKQKIVMLTASVIDDFDEQTLSSSLLTTHGVQNSKIRRVYGLDLFASLLVGTFCSPPLRNASRYIRSASTRKTLPPTESAITQR